MKTNHLELNLHSPLRSACFNEKTQEFNLQLASELNGEAARRISRWHAVNLVCILFLVWLGWSSAARAQTALDGFNPGPNDWVYTLAVQPDGKILVGGGFTTLGGGGAGTTPRHYIGRLNPDGSLDTSFDPGANNAVSTIEVQADGKILVGGWFTTLGGGGTGTTPRNHIGRLNPDGTLDPSFDPGADNWVDTLAVQSDGKILVGGNFTMLGGGGTGTTQRNYIGRLNPDGTLDTSFNPRADDRVFTLALQPDGKILVGGAFWALGGSGTGMTQHWFIGRLNLDGSLDTSFNPGANSGVDALAVQPDGKILVGGEFKTLGGGGMGTTPRNYIGRLYADGSLDTSFETGSNGLVSALAVQADGKILVGGDFTTLGGGGTGTTTRNHIGRLNPDGSLDAGFDPGANNDVSTLAVEADGKILVGGGFYWLGGGGAGTTARNYIGRLYADGSLDTSLNPGAGSEIRALAVQPDGKILVGGLFTVMGGGGPGTTPRNSIGRLNPDGSLDASFDPGANGPVYTLALQPDGKILVGGNFTMLGGGGQGTTMRNYIGRLNPDGSLDTGFDPGANNWVGELLVQPDGKILVGGWFTTLGGGGTGTTTHNYIGRLNQDGSPDTSFNPGASGPVWALAVQTDGKILVGGNFTMLGGSTTEMAPRYFIGRLSRQGSLDTTFIPGANSPVLALVVQPDGNILVGGGFTTLGGGGIGTTPRSRIGRLSPEGSLDTSFDPGANEYVYALSVQPNGKVLVGGKFTTLGGGGTGTSLRSAIGRLNSDGNLDTSFDPGANNYVIALAVQHDGKILAGGAFTMLGGGGTGTAPRYYIGRLTNTESALENLGVDSTGSVITWSRSGAGPEVERVTLESSSDGINYSPLGVGARVSGGWQLSGVSLPKYQNVFLRARGFFSTGQYNGSGSIVESAREVFLIPPRPPTVTTDLATNVTSGSATLNGTVNPNGSATTIFFEWGPTSAYGNTTFVQSIGNGTINLAVTADLIGLIPDTLYHYRVVATNSAGTTQGGDVPFVASLCSATTVNPTSQSFSALGGNGSMNVTAACNWTAVPSDPWITIPSGGTGSGNGTINYAVGSHSNSTPRSGTITIGAVSLAVFQGAQFADVPTSHGFYEQIGRLSARGIT